MRLHRLGQALRPEQQAIPVPQPGQMLLKVRACAVCRTDLHVIDGELPDARLPIVPGHEIVADVMECNAVTGWPKGTRVGVPWLGYTCGQCQFCVRDQENLCDFAQFTGYQLDGGFAEHLLADARYCFQLPATIDDVHAAPLMCAGLIGYRSLRMTGDAKRLGLFGFGAAAHILAQVALFQGRDIYAFTRPGDTVAQEFARQLGACWAGDSGTSPPGLLDAAIIFAPVGELVPIALRAVRKAGIVVCGGIHMSDIPAFDYAALWGERVVRSVANLTRLDALEFLELAARIPVQTHVETFPLVDANLALARLSAGQLRGAAVLVP
jgi:propanol-preferring alcohol dehydrogenase